MSADPGDTPLRTIELRVDRLSHLFDPLDPFPAHSRDLSRGAEDFIVGWARDFPPHAPIRILLHVAEQEAQGRDTVAIARGVSSYFSSGTERAASDLRELFRLGRIYLLIGVGVLAVCAIGAQLASSLIGGAAGEFVSNALIILGWVANWRPIEILLYDWWPLLKRKRIYRRLSVAPVEIRLTKNAAPEDFRSEVPAQPTVSAPASAECIAGMQTSTG